MPTLGRSMVALAVAMSLGACGGGGGAFDYVFIADKAFASNTSKMFDEYNRADAASRKGPDGALPKFLSTATEIVSGGGQPILTADNRSMIALKSDAIQIVSTLDGKVQSSVTAANDEHVVAIHQNGKTLATVASIQGKQHIFLVAVPAGTRIDAGDLGAFNTNATSAFVGDSLYVVTGDQTLIRVSPDGTRATVATPDMVPGFIKAEPLGNKLWGVARKNDNSANVLFHVDNGGTEMVALDIPRFPNDFAIAPGGRILYVEGAFWLTGPGGTSPQEISGGGVSGVSHLALSPDANWYLGLGFGTLGVSMSIARSEKNADSKSGAFLLTDGVVPTTLAFPY